MATFTQIFVALTFLVAVSNAAPNQDINLKLPKECKGMGFCNIKPEGYDEMLDLIDRLLTPAFVEATQKNIEGRTGVPRQEYSPQDDWHNCPYVNQTEWPYFYSHSDDSDFDVIIQNNKLLQPIQSITCAYDKIKPINTTEQCFQDLGLKSFDMKSSCQTSTADRTLIVLDKKTKKLVTKTYPVNCCCTCHIYRIDETQTSKID